MVCMARSGLVNGTERYRKIGQSQGEANVTTFPCQFNLAKLVTIPAADNVGAKKNLRSTQSHLPFFY